MVIVTVHFRELVGQRMLDMQLPASAGNVHFLHWLTPLEATQRARIGLAVQHVLARALVLVGAGVVPAGLVLPLGGGTGPEVEDVWVTQ